MNTFWLEFGRYFSLYVCHSLIFYIMADCRFSQRANRWIWALLCVFCVFLTVWMTFMDLFYTSWFYVIISALTMMAYVLCFVYVSRWPWKKTLFVFSIYATIFYLALQLSYVMMLIWFPDRVWASFIPRTVLLCLAILLMWRHWRPFMDLLEMNIGRNWGIMAFFSVTTNVVIYATAAVWVVRLSLNPISWLTMLLAETALVVLEYAALVRIVILLGQQQTARAEEAQRKLLESQLTAERTYVEQARAHRHDIRHYMVAISGYIEQEDLAGARAYLAEHQALLDNEQLLVYCENTVANALLRLYQNRCQAEGVACEIKANIPENIALSGLELSTVLGNILENAWEANSRALVPKLAFRAYNNNGLLLIEVENGVSGEVKFRDGLPQTNKDGGGQGLKNVVQVLEMHGGMLQCAQHGDIFFTQIILPV